MRCLETRSQVVELVKAKKEWIQKRTVVAQNEIISTCIENKRNLLTCNHGDQWLKGTNERLERRFIRTSKKTISFLRSTCRSSLTKRSRSLLSAGNTRNNDDCIHRYTSPDRDTSREHFVIAIERLFFVGRQEPYVMIVFENASIAKVTMVASQWLLERRCIIHWREKRTTLGWCPTSILHKRHFRRCSLLFVVFGRCSSRTSSSSSDAESTCPVQSGT